MITENVKIITNFTVKNLQSNVTLNKISVISTIILFEFLNIIRIISIYKASANKLIIFHDMTLLPESIQSPACHKCYFYWTCVPCIYHVLHKLKTPNLLTYAHYHQKASLFLLFSGYHQMQILWLNSKHTYLLINYFF